MEHYTFNIDDSRRIRAMRREVELLRKRCDACEAAAVIMGIIIAALAAALIVAAKS